MITGAQPKLPLKVTNIVRVTKLSDDVFEGNHPNTINEGYVKEGVPIYGRPEVGYSFAINNFYTSTVQEIVSDEGDKGVFKTLNSTYKWEVIGEGKLTV